MTDNHERIVQARALVDQALQSLAFAMLMACPGPHNFVQRRDDRPPWCEACGYAVNGERTAQMGA